MGITQDECDRRAANNSSGNSRRIHHRTLLGLHLSSERLRRISSRASPMETLAGRELGVRRRRHNSLRPAIDRNLRQTAAFCSDLRAIARLVDPEIATATRPSQQGWSDESVQNLPPPPLSPPINAFLWPPNRAMNPSRTRARPR